MYCVCVCLKKSRLRDTDLNTSMEVVLPSFPIIVMKNMPISPLCNTLSLELEMFRVTRYRVAGNEIFY